MKSISLATSLFSGEKKPSNIFFEGYSFCLSDPGIYNDSNLYLIRREELPSINLIITWRERQCIGMIIENEIILEFRLVCYGYGNYINLQYHDHNYQLIWTATEAIIRFDKAKAQLLSKGMEEEWRSWDIDVVGGTDCYLIETLWKKFHQLQQ